MSIFEKLDTQSVIKVIDLVTVFRGVNRSQVLGSIAGGQVSASSISRRKAFPRAFIHALEETVFSLPIAERTAILGFVSQIVRIERPSLSANFSGWIDLNDVTNDTFAKRCTEENGEYLIFRSPAEGEVEIAEMNITFDETRNITPAFETNFYRDNEVYSSVRGVAFQLGSYAYTIGKVAHNPYMRISKLRLYSRPRGETDLYGIRISTSQSTNRPYAHFVYCYQLKRRRSFSTIRKLLAVTDFNDDILDKEIDEIAEIRRLLREPVITENGIVSQPFGDH